MAKRAALCEAGLLQLTSPPFPFLGFPSLQLPSILPFCFPPPPPSSGVLLLLQPWKAIMRIKANFSAGTCAPNFSLIAPNNWLQ